MKSNKFKFVEQWQKYLQKDLVQIGEPKYLIGGPYAWNTIYIGQTELWPHTFWVYNSTHNFFRQHECWRYFFIQREFPSNPSNEFWVVDMFNNHKFITSVKRQDMLFHVKRHLSKGTISTIKLIESLILYGTPETRTFFQTHLLSKRTYSVLCLLLFLIILFFEKFQHRHNVVDNHFILSACKKNLKFNETVNK